MITLYELSTQNHQIKELSKVLRYLFADRSICDTETAGELFFRYLEKLDTHLDAVDHLYPALLRDQNPHVNNIAKNFMGGGQQLKRIIAGYKKTWSDKKTHHIFIEENYEKFLHDTGTFFEIILKRIEDETEHLYPEAPPHVPKEKAA